MARLNDFRLVLGGKPYVPIMVGGMGVDISTGELAIEIARLGGIGHLSDAMTMTVTDRRYGTRHQTEKARRHLAHRESADKRDVHFDLEALREATWMHVARVMGAKRGPGAIFINVMEKLTMNAPKETLKVRLEAALDGGIDGVTLSAGLHLGSLELIKDHPRFREVPIGIIVSSARALKLFLQRARRVDRRPDYVVVEGPLAGGHLGFGPDDWRQADLVTIMGEVLAFLEAEGLAIPVIPAGGIFTGDDAVGYMRRGAAAVQVATRFTITRECGLPEGAKQTYLRAKEEDVLVTTLSPTGYPMRMLKS
ncbi:MAG: nitronate monooxygenase, partial [Candidatus Sericytochromatia bacterium]